MRVDLFDYPLPADLIAQQPHPRGTSRLLRLDRTTGAVSHYSFADLPRLLEPGDLLVRNDVAVRRARLYGHDPEGRIVEIFLLKQIGEDAHLWTALAKPGRRAKAGRAISFSGGLTALVEGVADDGRRSVRFDREMDANLLEQIGHVPLPPYIRREPGATDRPEDRDAYQTVFARNPLAVAAPTAGLHFSEQIFEKLRARGIAIADLTLAVGAGTFKPLVTGDTEDHSIEEEEVFLPASTQLQVRRQLETRGRIVAVGTTVTRALEAAVRRDDFTGGQDLRFTTDLVITPGFPFQAVGALLTNFHLPRSTLLMLVCGFAGRERTLAAYAEAVREKYRFYSFGDAMLVV
jgi:S-adenosylmethionine:tRNA ribosyltransferase-isomerase